MTETTADPREQFLQTIRNDGHDRETCPGCGRDTNVALTDLVYTFERCSCDCVDYVHLIERLWHRECFLKPGNTEE